MRVPAVALLLAVAACGSSGSSGASTDAGGGARLAAQPWQRDPFTRTSLVEIDGIAVGYLVEYQAIPAAVDVERALPTGSYRIQGRDFEDIGFISPRGEVRRFRGNESDSLGAWGLEDGLRTFFGGGLRVRLTALEPAPARAAAPAAAATGDAAAEAGGASEDAPADESSGK